jgi:hypothetical protein
MRKQAMGQALLACPFLCYDGTALAQSPMKSILSLDLGTTTGWALRSRDGSIVSGSQSFKPERFESGGMRILRFSRWLTKIAVEIVGCPPPCVNDAAAFRENTLIDQIVFEEVRRHIGTDASHVYGGLLGQLEMMAELRQIPCEGIPVGTIKKHATGKGNAGKPLMIAAMQGLGYNPVDDNEADALALLHYAIERY